MPSRSAATLACKKGAPLWMLTYADLMSILMAMFVLLFSLSEIDANKFRSMAESFNDTLNVGAPVDEKSEFLKRDKNEDQKVIEELKPLYESLIELFKRDLKESETLIEYNKDTDSVFIRFPNSIAFKTGSAELRPKFKAKLRKFFVLRNEDEVYVKVLGHSDKTPIASGARYRSNLELSSSRASRVAEELVNGRLINSDSIEAIGYGSSRGISVDDTPEEMAKDRRVEILIQNKSANTLQSFNYLMNAKQDNI